MAAKPTTPQQPAPRLSLRGMQKYLNVVEAPKLENRRLSLLVVALAVAVFMLSAGLFLMLPLKERIPYVVQVEADATGQRTGRVTVSDGRVEQFTPDEANIRYFLGKWAIDLLTIDNISRSVRLPASYGLLKGDALRDWRRFITETEKPMARLAEKPSLRQRAELISLTFLNRNTVMIRVKLTTNDHQKERRVQITLNYAMVSPKTEEEVYRNPIGIWITTFGVNDELV